MQAVVFKNVVKFLKSGKRYSMFCYWVRSMFTSLVAWIRALNRAMVLEFDFTATVLRKIKLIQNFFTVLHSFCSFFWKVNLHVCQLTTFLLSFKRRCIVLRLCYLRPHHQLVEKRVATFFALAQKNFQKILPFP